MCWPYDHLTPSQVFNEKKRQNMHKEQPEETLRNRQIEEYKHEICSVRGEGSMTQEYRDKIVQQRGLIPSSIEEGETW